MVEPTGLVQSVGDANVKFPVSPTDKAEPDSGWKPKIVVILGATGSGKSKLAIDLASHFPIEIINADSMQVYRGLDVLTNKVPLKDQKGVPHHLLGTISPNVEFTAKDFRDIAIPLIEEIWARKQLPVIVGGTNYYIQALVTPFLLDNITDEAEEGCSDGFPGDKEQDGDIELEVSEHTYARLVELDPIAANRIHPNDQRKISQYLSLFARFGVLPSKLLQEKTLEAFVQEFFHTCVAGQNWGRVDESTFDCCFICVDASMAVLDDHVGRRVDCMVSCGLLEEVFDIYTLNADYTKGIRQAIGVREFADSLRSYIYENQSGSEEFSPVSSPKRLKENLWKILDSPYEDEHRSLLRESIEKVKLNTRRLVRRQKRRLRRLQMLFGWNIHYVDATESIMCLSDDIWRSQVVDNSVKFIESFLDGSGCYRGPTLHSKQTEMVGRNLWTQYVCEACGNKVLRGTHEWEQHRQGRNHRKRISRLKKSGGQCPKGEDPKMLPQ